MEDQAYAPDEICAAILRGEEADVATVRQWLDTGGDANAKCPGTLGTPWESVLQRAARQRLRAKNRRANGFGTRGSHISVRLGVDRERQRGEK